MALDITCHDNMEFCNTLSRFFRYLIFCYLLSVIVFWPTFVWLYRKNVRRDMWEDSHHVTYHFYVLSVFLQFFNIIFLISTGFFIIFKDSFLSTNPKLHFSILLIIIISLIITLSLISLYHIFLLLLSAARFWTFIRRTNTIPSIYGTQLFSIFVLLAIIGFACRYTRVIRVLNGDNWMLDDQVELFPMKILYHSINTVFLITSFLHLPLTFSAESVQRSDSYIIGQTSLLTTMKMFNLTMIIIMCSSHVNVDDEVIYLTMLISDFLITPMIISLSYLGTYSEDVFNTILPFKNRRRTRRVSSVSIIMTITPEHLSYQRQCELEREETTF